jgi:5-methylcytosine-specific restriction endonuclease McrA
MLQHLKDVVKGKTSLFKKRSSQWPKIRKQFLDQNSWCAACGWTENLEVHHIKPFHLEPSLELDLGNLITLCDKSGIENCHIKVGHLGNFKKENPSVREDAAKLLKGIVK